MSLRPITPEQKRILQAAADGRLSFDHVTYRYRIEGEDPPARRDRERLQKRGMLTYPTGRNRSDRTLTDKGIDALLNAPVSDAPPSKPVQLALSKSAPGVDLDEEAGS